MGKVDAWCPYWHAVLTLLMDVDCWASHLVPGIVASMMVKESVVESSCHLNFSKIVTVKLGLLVVVAR